MKQYRITYKNGGIEILDQKPDFSSLYEYVEEREISKWNTLTLYSVYYVSSSNGKLYNNSTQLLAGSEEEAIHQLTELMKLYKIKSCTLYKDKTKILEYAGHGLGQ